MIMHVIIMIIIIIFTTEKRYTPVRYWLFTWLKVDNFT